MCYRVADAQRLVPVHRKLVSAFSFLHELVERHTLHKLARDIERLEKAFVETKRLYPFSGLNLIASHSKCDDLWRQNARNLVNKPGQQHLSVIRRPCFEMAEVLRGQNNPDSKLSSL